MHHRRVKRMNGVMIVRLMLSLRLMNRSGWWLRNSLRESTHCEQNISRKKKTKLIMNEW